MQTNPTLPDEASARHRGISLAGRILAAMSLIAFVPLLIMSMQGLHCSRQAIVELEDMHLQSVLQSRKARLEAWLQARERDLRLCGLLIRAETADGDAASNGVSDRMASFRSWIEEDDQDRPLYESLAVYDAQWRPLGGDLGTEHSHGADFPDDPLKARLSTASGIVASAEHLHADGHIGLHIGTPMSPDDPQARLYIVANVNLEDTLSELLADRAGLGAAGIVYLLSATGRYLAVPDANRDWIGRQASVPADLLRPDAGRVLTYAGASGVRVLGSSAWIPGFDWVLVAEIPAKQALAWLSVLGHRAAWTGLLTFAVVLMLAARFSRTLASPMRALAETARRITEGSHQERVARLRGPEARDVGQAFNEMLDALTQAHQRVVQSASLVAIGELSASVVHEMRNPLSSIKINLQALRNKVRGDANYEELADIAAHQALRLERMLSELLQFGKPVTVQPADVPFLELLDEAMAGLRDIADAKGVRVRVEDELGRASLRVDREQMRRALANLLKNAIEASPDGGEVIVRAGLPADGGPQVDIQVHDAGPGIPAAMMPRLFQPFATTRDDGTGLGLAIVKKIVEMHGGIVRAENADDGGALFTLCVPRTPDPL